MGRQLPAAVRPVAPVVSARAWRRGWFVRGLEGKADDRDSRRVCFRRSTLHTSQHQQLLVRASPRVQRGSSQGPGFSLSEMIELDLENHKQGNEDFLDRVNAQARALPTFVGWAIFRGSLPDESVTKAAAAD